MGIVATLATDLWQRLVQAVAGLPPANWGLVGRWVAWFPRGVFLHRPISATAPVAGERAIGWVFHYVVGIAYAAAYVAIVRLRLTEPTLPSAMIFAVVLLIAPWFVMQPAMGFGVMASRAPKPGVARTISATSHLAFGLGLYLGIIAPFVGLSADR